MRDFLVVSLPSCVFLSLRLGSIGELMSSTVQLSSDSPQLSTMVSIVRLLWPERRLDCLRPPPN